MTTFNQINIYFNISFSLFHLHLRSTHILLSKSWNCFPFLHWHILLHPSCFPKNSSQSNNHLCILQEEHYELFSNCKKFPRLFQTYKISKYQLFSLKQKLLIYIYSSSISVYRNWVCLSYRILYIFQVFEHIRSYIVNHIDNYLIDLRMGNSKLQIDHSATYILNPCLLSLRGIHHYQCCNLQAIIQKIMFWLTIYFLKGQLGQKPNNFHSVLNF